MYLSVSQSLPATAIVKPVEIWLIFNLAYPFLVILSAIIIEVFLASIFYNTSYFLFKLSPFPISHNKYKSSSLFISGCKGKINESDPSWSGDKETKLFIEKWWNFCCILCEPFGLHYILCNLLFLLPNEINQ